MRPSRQLRAPPRHLCKPSPAMCPSPLPRRSGRSGRRSLLQAWRSCGPCSRLRLRLRPPTRPV
eukprot:8991414-Alexandrium_andersonii.AAC.1